MEDWDASAGAATGSETTVAEDVFVPAHRIVSFGDVMTGRTPDRSDTGVTGRDYGLLGYTSSRTSPPCSWASPGVPTSCSSSGCPARGITYTNWTEQSLYPITQIQVADADNKISAAEALSRRWLEVLQKRADADEQPTPEEKAVLRGQTAFAVELCREAVEVLFRASGGSVIQRGVDPQRFHRDIEGFSLHALVQLNANLEVQGRVLLGMDPATDFL
ncbi:hypothetical protein [Streptomyces sp. ST2-7A]|uniref:hypothetical protein n=1 Tax=Streptomyces sp. ST2-7A TaxID=2907214 RepID=UPI001F28204D|nr:hypothetical protein [Streptomyces sp. ST2-7A]MCE7080342.1 hypothetical protein [Streptomyces sp. ST2-7A]